MKPFALKLIVFLLLGFLGMGPGPTLSAEPPGVRIGVLPCMPLPIGEGADLEFARPLNLSPDQDAACQRFLEEYWAQWRVVQEAEFDTFAKLFDEVNGIPWSRPDAENVRRFVAQKARVRQGLRVAEEQFFATLCATLAESQLATVDELRRSRDIAFSGADPLVVAWFDGTRPIDVLELVRQAGLENDVLAQSLTVGYSERSERLLHQLDSRVDRARVCWIDRVKDLPFTPVSPDASQAELAGHREPRKHWADCLRPASEIAEQYLMLNHHTVQSVCLQLPVADSRELQARYDCTLGQLLKMDCDLQWTLEAVLAAPNIADDARLSITNLYDDWYKKARPLRDLIAKGGIARSVRLPAGLKVGISAPTPAEDASMQSQFPLQDLRRSVEVKLETMLPPEALREARQKAATRRHENRAPPAERALAGRITPASAGFSAKMVERVISLTGESLDQMATQAIAAFEPRYDAAFKRCESLHVSFGQERAVDLAAENARIKAWRDSITELRNLDDELLRSMEQAGVSATPLSLVRLHRISQHGRWMKQMCAPELLGDVVDIVGIVASGVGEGELELSPASLPVLINQALSLEAQIGEFCVRMDERSKAILVYAASDRLRPAPHERADPLAWDEIAKQQQEFFAEFESADNAMKSSHLQLLTLTNSAAIELCPAFEKDQTEEIQTLLAQGAFQSILDDFATAKMHFRSALHLPTLTPGQRDALIQQSSEFYEQSRAKVNESIARLWSYALSASKDPQTVTTLQLEQLRIDQRRWAQEFETDLKRILNQDQLVAIGANSTQP